MNPTRLIGRALSCVACILAVDLGGASCLALAQQEQPEGTPPRLRAPWADRARDLGTVSAAGIRVVSDADRAQSLRLAQRVATVRAALASAFGPVPLRTTEAPRLFVFEDLGELRFTLRTQLGVEVPPVSAVFVDHPDGGVVAVTTDPESPRGTERALHAAAFDQYAQPRFGEALPPWAQVGLAEYIGEVLFAQGGWESGHVSEHAIRLLRRAAAAERLLPLGRLIRLTPDQWTRFEATHGAALLHAEAWSLVQFMLHGNGGALARGFSRWLEQVAAGSDPTASFEAIVNTAGGGASMTVLEEAWRASIETLEPSAVLGGLERIELLRLGLQDLEREGIRPTGPEELMERLSERPPIEHAFFTHPYERTVSSTDAGVLEASGLEFLPVRSGFRTSEDVPTPPPPAVGLTESGNWEIRIEWHFDPEQALWVPWVSAMPRR